MLDDFLLQMKYAFSRLFMRGNKQQDESVKSAFKALKDEVFDFDLIERYFRGKDNADAHQVITDRTHHDLDMDDLFMFIDRTHSKVGQQFLYNQYRTLNNANQKTELNEALIEQFTLDLEWRRSVQSKIQKLSNKDTYYISALFQDKHIEAPKWFFAIKLLSLLALVFVILSFFKPVFIIGIAAVFCINFVIHYWNKNNLVNYVNALPQLLKLNTVTAELFEDDRFSTLKPNLSSSINLIKEVKSRMSLFQLDSKLQGEFEIIAWFMLEVVKTLFLLEPLLLFSVLNRLDTRRGEIQDVFEFVGHIDMLLSISSLRNGLDEYCIPSIGETESQLVAKDVYHPLIHDCVKNSIQAGQKSVLLTGSNMSGKTSFIRAIGLNMIMGSTLNTCFASQFDFPEAKVHSAIRISDDLLNDKSYYFEEVLTIKTMLEEGEKPAFSLFLLDEIFKGTNTVERIAAGKAVLSSLAKNNNLVFVATHDIELTEMLSDQYDLYHFSEILDQNKVGFDYKLKVGKLKNRNAIKILEMNNYSKEVIDDAMRVARDLDEESMLRFKD
jgi:hypothetical protein